jgi:hypothetical protein
MIKGVGGEGYSSSLYLIKNTTKYLNTKPTKKYKINHKPK